VAYRRLSPDAPLLVLQLPRRARAQRLLLLLLLLLLVPPPPEVILRAASRPSATISPI
jgi:hypothetical protein